MATRKDRMSLLSRYNKLHFQRYNTKNLFNINAEQWSSDAIIESYGLETCYDLLDYYFSVSSNPSWNYFSYNTEKIFQAKIEVEQDIEERLQRRKLAKKWIDE